MSDEPRAPLDVPCPRCHAPKGVRCTGPTGDARAPHAIRKRYAARGWEQLPLFDGDDLKARGQALALDGAPTWTAQALAWVHALPIGRRFTSEDLTDALGLPRGEHGNHRNNAVGAVMSGASRRGLIVRTGAFVRARAPINHSHLCAIWARVPNERKSP